MDQLWFNNRPAFVAGGVGAVTGGLHRRRKPQNKMQLLGKRETRKPEREREKERTRSSRIVYEKVGIPQSPKEEFKPKVNLNCTPIQ